MSERPAPDLDAARALLREAGVEARLELTGADADVLAVDAAPASLAAVSKRAEELRRLTGARFVAMDLGGTRSAEGTPAT